MTMNIGKTFLYRAENSRFRLARKPPKILRKLQIDLDLAPLREALYVPAKCRSKSSFVQQGRMKQVRNRADFSTQLLYQRRAVVNRSGNLGEAIDVGSHGGKVHSQRRQHLSHAVVQLASDAPSLIILQLDQARREFAQVLIGGTEFRRTFPDRIFQFELRCPQLLLTAAACFSHRNQAAGNY